MDGKRRTIEIDENVAVALERRATERGESLDDLLTEYVGDEGVVVLSPEELAELNAAMDDFRKTGLGVPFEEVAEWMNSWGTENELPVPKVRCLWK